MTIVNGKKVYEMNDVPATIELSDYIRSQIAAITNGGGPAETIARVIAKGVYAIAYHEKMQLRRGYQEMIGKAVVRGDMDTVTRLAAELRSTYAER